MKVAGGSRFDQLTVGGNHQNPAIFGYVPHSGSNFCGLTGEGQVYCWGYDSLGQVGTPGFGWGAEVLVPEPIDIPGRVKAIDTGVSHTCALTEDERVFCWGSNDSGRLGLPESFNVRLEPHAIEGSPSLVDVEIGNGAACGLTEQGLVHCWGSNSRGQLGSGDFPNHTTPVAGGGGMSFAQISTNGTTACGLTAEGEIWCWGSELLDYAKARSAPVRVAAGATFRSVSVGAGHACALDTLDRPWCWGHVSVIYGPYPEPRLIETEQRFVQISPGNRATAAIDSAGRLYTWGGEYWALDDVPRLFDSDLGFREIQVTPGSNLCGLTVDGVARCIRAGTSWSVVEGVQFATIATGGACGLTDEGAAWCWKPVVNNVGEPLQAEPVAGELRFRDLSVGSSATCGVATDGRTYCWGNRGLGQLGDGRWAGSEVPVEIPIG